MITDAILSPKNRKGMKGFMKEYYWRVVDIATKEKKVVSVKARNFKEAEEKVGKMEGVIALEYLGWDEL